MKAVINSNTAKKLYSKLLKGNKVTCRQVCQYGTPEWFYTKHYSYSKSTNDMYIVRVKGGVPEKCLDSLVEYIRINLEPSVQVVK